MPSPTPFESSAGLPEVPTTRPVASLTTRALAADRGLGSQHNSSARDGTIEPARRARPDARTSDQHSRSPRPSDVAPIEQFDQLRVPMASRRPTIRRRWSCQLILTLVASEVQRLRAAAVPPELGRRRDSCTTSLGAGSSPMSEKKWCAAPREMRVSTSRRRRRRSLSCARSCSIAHSEGCGASAVRHRRRARRARSACRPLSRHPSGRADARCRLRGRRSRPQRRFAPPPSASPRASWRARRLRPGHSFARSAAAASPPIRPNLPRASNEALCSATNVAEGDSTAEEVARTSSPSTTPAPVSAAPVGGSERPTAALLRRDDRAARRLRQRYGRDLVVTVEAFLDADGNVTGTARAKPFTSAATRSVTASSACARGRASTSALTDGESSASGSKAVTHPQDAPRAGTGRQERGRAGAPCPRPRLKGATRVCTGSALSAYAQSLRRLSGGTGQNGSKVPGNPKRTFGCRPSFRTRCGTRET